MGYIRNHAIVVTATCEARIKAAYAVARYLFGPKKVSRVTPVQTNGSRSFFVPPDGSKEGWTESNTGDENREKFVAWLQKQAYSDGSSPYDWVEVRYGGDDDTCDILAGCKPKQQ